MPYPGLVAGFGMVIICLIGLAHFKQKKKPGNTLVLHLRGIWVVVIVLVVATIIVLAFTQKTQLVPRYFGIAGYFSLFSLGLFAALLVIFTTSFAIGNPIMNWAKVCHSSSHILMSVAIGLSIFTLYGTLLALWGQLNAISLWIAVAGIWIWQYKNITTVLYDLFIKKRSFKLKKIWSLAVYGLLIIVTAINWAGSIKPFPVGYDGATLYANTANLIHTSQALPAGGHAYYWSVLMGMGQTMYNSPTIAILLSHFMAIFCLWAIYLIARLFLKPPYAALAASIPYIAPYFGYHSFIDEKVDLGVLFIVLATFHFGLENLFKPQKTARRISTSKLNLPLNLVHWAIIGWMCGFAFGIKYTALFFLMAIICMYNYWWGQRFVFLSTFLICLGVVFISPIYTFSHIRIGPTEATILGTCFSLAGISMVVFQLQKVGDMVRNMLLPMVILFLFFGIAFLPWAAKHLGENKQLSIQSALVGKADSPELIVPRKYLSSNRNFGPNYHKKSRPDQKVQKLLATFEQPENQENKNNSPTTKTSKKPSISQASYEEIIRYLGYEPGIWKYISLPYDLTLNSNIPGLRYLDISFLFLLLFPLLLLLAPTDWKSHIRNAAIFALLLFWVALCYRSYFHNAAGWDVNTLLSQIREFQYIDNPLVFDQFFANIYSLTIPFFIKLGKLLEGIYQAGASLSFSAILVILLLLGGLLYWNLAGRLKRLPTLLKLLYAFLFVSAFLWLVLGNGIIWYAFSLWTLLPIVLVRHWQNPATLLGREHRSFSSLLFGVVFGVYIFCNSLIYLTNPLFKGPSYGIFNWTFIEYFATNPVSSREKVIENLNPDFSPAILYLNQDKSEKIYKVNTFLGYHIEQNDRRVYNDPVLGKYEEIINVIKSDTDFLSVLKDNGYHYILYDLGTAAVDKTAEKSLAKRSTRLLRMLDQSQKAQLLVTDHFIKDPNAPLISLPNGQQEHARKGIFGEIAYSGSFVLYKIL